MKTKLSLLAVSANRQILLTELDKTIHAKTTIEYLVFSEKGAYLIGIHGRKMEFPEIIELIDNTDFIIVDTSTPSTDIGYIVGYRLSTEKKVICLTPIESQFDPTFMNINSPYLKFIKYRHLSEISRQLTLAISS